MYNDILGDEMKVFEGVEAQRRFEKFKPIIARIDGRTFHTFTKGMQKPYDDDMSQAMINTTIKLVESTQATIGYTQSDEITLIWANRDENSPVFFDGRIQKMCSQLGALSTLYFNREVMTWDRPEYFEKMPTFDARVWQVPDLHIAERTLTWREHDCVKNSISMLAQHHFPHNELQNKSGVDMMRMLLDIGVDWNTNPLFFKLGTHVKRVKSEHKFTTEELENLPEKHHARVNPDLTYIRSEVKPIKVPLFKMYQSRVDFLFGE